jgi:hypothetical protein
MEKEIQETIRKYREEIRQLDELYRKGSITFTESTNIQHDKYNECKDDVFDIAWNYQHVVE